MTTTAPADDGRLAAGLDDGLRLDFLSAGAEFTEARRHQRTKDTPAHRAAVRDSRARVDAVLDLYLELRHGRPALSRPR